MVGILAHPIERTPWTQWCEDDRCPDIHGPNPTPAVGVLSVYHIDLWRMTASFCEPHMAWHRDYAAECGDHSYERRFS